MEVEFGVVLGVGVVVMSTGGVVLAVQGETMLAQGLGGRVGVEIGVGVEFELTGLEVV